MVSLLHEGVIELVRDHPAFAADLLDRLLGLEVPAFTEARLAEATLNKLVPVEYRADAVVVFTERKPVFGAIIEAQLQRDDDKLYTWPLYAVGARERHRCPFVVIVVTPDPATATWAARTIDIGGGVRFWPLVVGPEGIPKMTDHEQARREPQLAVLSVMAHGQGDVETATAIADAATTAISQLPKDQRLLYSLLIQSNLSTAARKAIEMHPRLEKFLTETQRQQLQQSRAEGRAEGEAAALLKILTRRGLELTPEQRRRITECTELAVLERWIDRSLSAGSIDEVLA
ncbi:MAG TPA: hypothetical protein VHT91_00230 [Kofleriaceae bacterium]|nr:hypothetical protein [Kofleriaceae bacterium]